MAQTGALGDITFEVSDEAVKTWSGLKRKLKARYTAHEVANEKAKLEFLGVDLQEIGFRVRLDAAFTFPDKELAVLEEVLRAGEPQPLVLGGRIFGEFVLQDFSENVVYTDNAGRTTVVYVDLKMTEHN